MVVDAVVGLTHATTRWAEESIPRLLNAGPVRRYCSDFPVCLQGVLPVLRRAADGHVGRNRVRTADARLRTGLVLQVCNSSQLADVSSIRTLRRSVGIASRVQTPTEGMAADTRSVANLPPTSETSRPDRTLERIKSARATVRSPATPKATTSVARLRRVKEWGEPVRREITSLAFVVEREQPNRLHDQRDGQTEDQLGGLLLTGRRGLAARDP